MSVQEQLKGLKQELLCHKLAREQAMAFNKCIRGFALGAATRNNPLYAALRRHPSGLQVKSRVDAEVGFDSRDFRVVTCVRVLSLHR